MTAFQVDRDATTSGKSRGGGLCLYINKEWSVNATLVTKHCSQLAELHRVLSPLLITLLTCDRASTYKGYQIIKFVDDTTVVGLSHRSDESMYREEVKHLEGWCRENNLVLSADRAKEMIIGGHSPSTLLSA